MSEDQERKPDAQAGMIGKRVLMPIGMWTEILGLARQAGGDHRDVLLQLLDLGLQAQDAGRFKERFVKIEGPAKDKLGVVAAQLGVTEDQALVRLLDIGLQAKADEIRKALPPAPPEGTQLRVELNGQLLAVTNSNAIPAQDEVLTLGGRHYVVMQRAWSVGHSGLIAYLRVKAYA